MAGRGSNILRWSLFAILIIGVFALHLFSVPDVGGVLLVVIVALVFIINKEMLPFAIIISLLAALIIWGSAFLAS